GAARGDGGARADRRDRCGLRRARRRGDAARVGRDDGGVALGGQGAPAADAPAGRRRRRARAVRGGGRGPGRLVSYDLVIRGGRVGGAVADVAIAGERIAAVGGPFEAALSVLDADGRVVSPAFVQPHIHLDKVLTGPLLGPNRSGTLSEAIALSHAVKRAATVEEIRE